MLRHDTAAHGLAEKSLQRTVRLAVGNHDVSGHFRLSVVSHWVSPAVASRPRTDRMASGSGSSSSSPASARPRRQRITS